MWCVYQGPEERVLQEAGPGAAQEPRPQREGEGAEGVAQDGRGGGQQGRITIKRQHQLRRFGNL